MAAPICSLGPGRLALAALFQRLVYRNVHRTDEFVQRFLGAFHIVSRTRPPPSIGRVESHEAGPEVQIKMNEHSFILCHNSQPLQPLTEFRASYNVDYSVSCR